MDANSFDVIWGEFTKKYSPDFLEGMMKKEITKLSHVNILISGKTGVGKTTLINKIFGKDVGKVGRGRPITDKIEWYEPDGIPLRLCDTKGLELKDYSIILDDLKAEIERCLESGKLEDKIHVAWICVAEPSTRVEEGEQDLAKLCTSLGIPYIVVLTKALGPEEFADDVRTLLPGAKSIVRVLSDDWSKPKVESFGLQELLDETLKLIPKLVEDALISAQKIDFDRKRNRGFTIAATSAAAAAAGSAVPIPGVGAGSFLFINITMLISIAAIFGVEINKSTATAIGTSTVGGLALSFGARMALGEALKLIPGLGSLFGGAVEASAAAASTYGIGRAFTEFLFWFETKNARMPDAEELKAGFGKYWSETREKSVKAPMA